MESSSGGNYARSHRINTVMVSGWVKLDYNHGLNPKLEGLTPLPRLVHIYGFALSARMLTNGFISEKLIPALAADCETTMNKMRPAIAKLVERGLFERVEGGYRIHDYDDWQQTSTKISSAPKHQRTKIRTRSSPDQGGDQDQIKSRSGPDQDQIRVQKVPEIQQETTPSRTRVLELEQELELEREPSREKEEEKEKNPVRRKRSVANASVSNGKENETTEQQQLPIPTETTDSPTITELGPKGFPIVPAYELIRAYCDAVGVNSELLSKADTARYMRSAKSMEKAGTTPDDITRLVRWMSANPFYKSSGIDFMSLPAARVRWLSLGCPDTFFQFTNGRESREQKLKAQHDELFRIANGELICDDTPGNSEDFVDVHSHLVQ